MQKMTRQEVQRFAEQLYAFQHKHAEIDRMKDVALYVLDLLQQGKSVNDVLKKLKMARELAGTDHVYTQCIDRFSQAIRLTRSTLELREALSRKYD